MELVDENEGYYDEEADNEIVDFLAGEALPELQLLKHENDDKNSFKKPTRLRLYEDNDESEPNPLSNT